MNVLVFGASGATGREVVKHALERGHSVAAFVRDPGKFEIKHANLALAVGDATEYVSVEHACTGQDAVASALGSGNSLGSHPTLTDGVQNIIRAMDHAEIRRFVYLSMLGVDGSGWQLGLVDRFIVLPLLLRNVVKDHAREEALIKQSTLDWVIVRPPRLTNGPYTGRYRSGEDVRERTLLASISRADVADFMVKQFTGDRYVHGTPAVRG
ncbi:NAD(P)-dependent oxidoreductase [Nitrosococcus watsonii]|uniref:NmrA family protein n=1 Tax=Nitrosococcus watsoni (strain C-113) TaxID=105559 RepID=D8KAK7_NITWC|nr:SDR family oxidoreductase [Nitrosococcus watsonii]ADJ29434.1 NmrA family protein [Nitrosococcus watsonii C-113]